MLMEGPLWMYPKLCAHHHKQQVLSTCVRRDGLSYKVLSTPQSLCCAQTSIPLFRGDLKKGWKSVECGNEPLMGTFKKVAWAGAQGIGGVKLEGRQQAWSLALTSCWVTSWESCTEQKSLLPAVCPVSLSFAVRAWWLQTSKLLPGRGLARTPVTRIWMSPSSHILSICLCVPFSVSLLGGVSPTPARPSGSGFLSSDFLRLGSSAWCLSKALGKLSGG